MIRCIAIDDEPLALKQMQGYIAKIPYLELLQGFNNATKALQYLQDHSVDLMLVDINMPDLSGMEFVKSLSQPPKVIFTTAYREYALEGFEVDAADYLLKPISFAAFAQSVEKVRQRYFDAPEMPDTPVAQEESSADAQFLFVKSEYRIVRVELAQIKYIESMRDYVRIHLEGDKPLMALLSMKSLMTQLPPEHFMRIHRSYIVNLRRVHTIERNRIVFDGDTYIPVSEQYREAFQDFLDHNFLK